MTTEDSLVCWPRTFDVDGNLIPPLPDWYSALKPGSDAPELDWRDAPYPRDATRHSVLQWLLEQIKEVKCLQGVAEERPTTSSSATTECLRTVSYSAPAETLAGLRQKRMRDVHWLLCALAASGNRDFDDISVPVLPIDRERKVWEWDEVLAYLRECERAVVEIQTLAPDGNVETTGPFELDPLKKLRASCLTLANDRLKAGARQIAVKVCGRSKDVPLSELATLEDVNWEPPWDRAWSSAQSRINKVLVTVGGRLRRIDNAVRLVRVTKAGKKATKQKSTGAATRRIGTRPSTQQRRSKREGEAK